MTTRRGVLALLGGAVGAGLIGGPAWAVSAPGGVRTVNLQNMNTGEVFNEAYWADGRYLPEALRKLNHFMRDHHTGSVADIDPHLFDLVNELQQRTSARGPFQMVCGYRCAKTNASMRWRGGVAVDSYHVRAKAVDLRLPGTQVRGLYETALSIGGGGVAVYPRADFVHMDTGPVRTWGAFAMTGRTQAAMSAGRKRS